MLEPSCGQPLGVPFATAVDLVVSPRSGPLSFRLPLATLTLLAPTLMILELHRLRTSRVRPPAGWDYWPEWLSLCPRPRECG